MKIDSRLLVSVSRLRSVPVGLPVVWPAANQEDWYPGLVIPGEPGPRYPDGGISVAWATSSGGTDMGAMEAVDLWLDLSRPEPKGSRADALPIVLGLFGWKPGGAVVMGPFRHGVSVSIEADGGDRVLSFWPEEPDASRIRFSTRVVVPDLAGIDPAHPNALRFGLGAILRSDATPWMR